MSKPTENPRSVNWHGTYAALIAAWSYAVWPTQEGSIHSWLFAVVTALLAVFGAIKAARAYWQDYQFRKAVNASQNSSGKYGSAHFANLHERMAAGLHDTNGMVFLGLCDGLPLFLPSGMLMVEARQGSGKTSRILVPSIIQALMTGGRASK